MLIMVISTDYVCRHSYYFIIIIIIIIILTIINITVNFITNAAFIFCY